MVGAQAAFVSVGGVTTSLLRAMRLADHEGIFEHDKMSFGNEPLNGDFLGYAIDEAACELIDPDHDGLANGREYVLGTDPRLADSDGDGFADGVEVAAGADPVSAISLPPAQISAVSGNNQTMTVGTVAGTVLKVRVSRAGAASAGVEVTFDAQAGAVSPAGNGAWAASCTATTNAAGEAMVDFQAPTTPGAVTVDVSASDAPGLAMSLTCVTSVVSSGTGQSAYAGTDFALPLTLSVPHAGVPQAGLAVPFQITGGWLLAANGSRQTALTLTTDSSSMVTVQVQAGMAAGPVTVTAAEPVMGTVVTYALTSLPWGGGGTGGPNPGPNPDPEPPEEVPLDVEIWAKSLDASGQIPGEWFHYESTDGTHDYESASFQTDDDEGTGSATVDINGQVTTHPTGGGEATYAQVISAAGNQYDAASIGNGPPKETIPIKDFTELIYERSSQDEEEGETSHGTVTEILSGNVVSSYGTGDESKTHSEPREKRQQGVIRVKEPEGANRDVTIIAKVIREARVPDDPNNQQSGQLQQTHEAVVVYQIIAGEDGAPPTTQIEVIEVSGGTMPGLDPETDGLRINPTLEGGAVQTRITVSLLPMEVKAYRPQEVENAIAWQLTRAERVIPDSEIDQKKIGIRVNKDGNDGGTENDLIEVEFSSAIPSGMNLVIKRSTNLLNVYGAQNATSPVLTSGTEVVVPSGSAPPRSYWVECTDALTGGNIEFYLRPNAGQDVKLKTLPFRSFTTVVAALSGETAFGADPLDHGTYDISEALYLKGYNVHYFDEGEEARCITELDNQGDHCKVTKAAVFGYSHGGGSVYRVVTASPGGLVIEFTGYIDAVNNSLTIGFGSEERFPTGSRFHFNYYQTNGALDGVPTNAPGANVERDFTATDDHYTIDNNATVQADLRTNLEGRLAP